MCNRNEYQVLGIVICGNIFSIMLFKHFLQVLQHLCYFNIHEQTV